MKRKKSNYDCSEWSEKEKECAELLLVLPRGKRWYSLTQLPSTLTWGLRRKRSAIQVTPSPSSSQTNHGGSGAGAVVKEQALSPITPLSFPATESDEKTKTSRKKTSLKRKREYYLQIIEDLTKNKHSLNQEIENVKRHCNQLKAFNLNLKARQEQLNNIPKSESKSPNLEIGEEEQLGQSNGSVKSSNLTAENEEQKQQQQQMQLAIQNQNFGNGVGEGVVPFRYVSGNHPTTSLPVAAASTSSTGLGRNVDSNKGPLSVEVLTQMTTANRCLSRSMAAQARQRRLQICRLKKPFGKSYR